MMKRSEEKEPKLNENTRKIIREILSRKKKKR